MRDPYKEKYKGMALALQTFSNVLCGHYVDYGAFEVYSDTSLFNSIDIALKMCLSFPEIGIMPSKPSSSADYQSYPKCLNPIYSFLHVVFRANMKYVSIYPAGQILLSQLLPQPRENWTSILRMLEDGLCSFDREIASMAGEAVWFMALYVIPRLQFQDPQKCGMLSNLPQSEDEVELWTSEAVIIRQLLSDQSDSLKRMLYLAFEVFCRSPGTWTIHSTLLATILMCPDEFVNLQQEYIKQQPIGEPQER